MLICLLFSLTNSQFLHVIWQPFYPLNVILTIVCGPGYHQLCLLHLQFDILHFTFVFRSEKLDEKDVVPEDSLETDQQQQQQQQSVSDVKNIDTDLNSDDVMTNSQSKVKTEEEDEDEEFVIEEFDY